jgi:hypothetical protein
MKKLLLLALLIGTTCTAQLKQRKPSTKYLHHWESTDPKKSDMEIIIHREGRAVRITEFKLDHKGKFGGGVIYSTVYVCTNSKGDLHVETIDPSTLQILNSEYILTKNKMLLRITDGDTLTFKHRY